MSNPWHRAGTASESAVERIKAGVLHSDPREARKPYLTQVMDYISELRRLGRDSMYSYSVRKHLENAAKVQRWGNLTMCTPKSISGYLRKLADRGLSPKTVNAHRADLAAFFAWCVRNGVLEANPCEQVPKSNVKGDKKRRALSVPEIKALLSAAPEQRRVVYLFLVFTGLRRAEAAAITWAHLKLDIANPHLQLDPSMTKSGCAESVPLVPEVVGALREHRGEADERDPVFAEIPSMPDFRADLKAAGIDEQDSPNEGIGPDVIAGEKYKFRYRLLASADIIGSTAFKSAQASQQQRWAHVFSGFFDEFPKAVSAAFEALAPSLVPNAKPAKCMDVWKLVGDEILFVAELSRHEEAAYHVLALKAALNSYSEKLSTKHRGLGLKGTVWGAGFPVMNVQVETQAGPDGAKVQDYLGPSVDLGFRLSSSADRRRIPVSADVALFLTRARQSSPSAAAALQLFADPPQVLKGINAGGVYPMLWIDRLDGQETPEDKLLHRKRTCDADALLAYLDDQFKNTSVGLLPPFIESDSSDHFKVFPDGFSKWRDKLAMEDSDLQYSQDAAKPNPEQTPTATSFPGPPKV